MSSGLRDGEVHEYLAAFQRSSDRARFALYIVTIATLLIAIANYNIQSWAWPLNRMHSWYAVNPKRPDPFFHDHAQLKDVREEYAKQFGARAVLTSSPIPGVSIDVNDVGLVGGIALVLLMLVQRLCVVREHENLFLALYKVRQLCKADEHAHRGNNDANLLYHALAMSQVISSPPTLARWQRRGILSHLNLVFYFPVFVFTWVLAGNYLSIDRAARYGLDVRPLLAVQTTVLLFMIATATSSWLHSRAMSLRWERAFFRVNPQLRLIDQPSQRAWLKLGKTGFASLVNRGRLQSYMPGRLAAELIDNVAFKQALAEGHSMASGDVAVNATIDSADVHVMLRKLFGSGMHTAKIWCATHNAELIQLAHFEPTMNELEAKIWRIAGTWSFSYKIKGAGNEPVNMA
jgi:hypothetical protein